MHDNRLEQWTNQKTENLCRFYVFYGWFRNNAFLKRIIKIERNYETFNECRIIHILYKVEKIYDGHKWARDEANMKEILVGWCEEDQRIHVCFEVESMEVMEKFMEKHAEVIASSGHKQETTVVKVLSDS